MDYVSNDVWDRNRALLLLLASRVNKESGCSLHVCTRICIFTFIQEGRR